MTRRPPHRDHSGPVRRSDASLSEADALAVTIDDGEHTPVDHLIDRADAVLGALESAAAERRGIDHDAKRAELEYLPGSAWGRQVDADLATIKAAIARPVRYRTLRTVLKGIGVGSLVGLIALLANALISHGDATAMGREQAERVRHHEEWIRDLQQRQPADDEAHGRRSRP